MCEEICVTLHRRKENAHTFETPRNSFCSLTLCWINSKETMTKMNSFPDHQAQQRRGKHSDGRQNASSFRDSIVTPDRILPRKEKELSRPTEYPMLQDGVLQRPTEYLIQPRKYSNGRQNACFHWMEYSHGRLDASAIGWSTPTADRMLPQSDGVLSRPTRCLMMSEATKMLRTS